MASVDGRKRNTASICDICIDDGEENEAMVFCTHCEKHLCKSCKLLHQKFCPTHKTVTGIECLEDRQPKDPTICERHEEEKVQYYCNEHGAVFCRFCGSLKHPNCVIRNIKGLCKDINIKAFTEETVNHIENVKEHVHKVTVQIAEGKHKYEANRENVNSLRADLNAAIDAYEVAYASSNRLWLDALHDDMKAVDNFEKVLKKERKHLEEDAAHVDNVERSFIACIKAKQISNEYDSLVNEFSSRLVTQPIFVYNDRKIPALSQKLAGLCNEAETSSEEVTDNTKVNRSFCNLKDMSLIQEIDTSQHMGGRDIGRVIGCCFMAGEKILLLCKSQRNKIKLLESDLTYKCDITVQRDPFDLAKVDNTMAAFTVSDEKIIQLVTIDPGLRLERVIQLSRNCFGITVHDQKFYVSTSSNRIEVISLHGTPIKTIKLSETADHLCVNTDATRIFYSCRREPWVTCITEDGHMLYRHIGLHERDVNHFIIDSEENILVAASDLRCAYTVKSGGKDRIVLDIDTQRIGIAAIAYNNSNDNVLFASVYAGCEKLQVYK